RRLHGGCVATLVGKLAVPPRLAATALNGMIAHYQDLGLSHRCRLVFVTSYLSEPQMVELAQASTYYVNAARAEGSCLPLQHFLAAGRPGIAPGHTALRITSTRISALSWRRTGSLPSGRT